MKKTGTVCTIILNLVVIAAFVCLVIMFWGISEGIISHSIELGWYDTRAWETAVVSGEKIYTYTKLDLIDIIGRIFA